MLPQGIKHLQFNIIRGLQRTIMRQKYMWNQESLMSNRAMVAVIEPLHTEHMCLLEQPMLLQEEPQSLLWKALVFIMRQ